MMKHTHTHTPSPPAGLGVITTVELTAVVVLDCGLLRWVVSGRVGVTRQPRCWQQDWLNTLR